MPECEPIELDTDWAALDTELSKPFERLGQHMLAEFEAQ
ncbi:hypothetical protein RB2083_2202 [Rhodobacteraceae bacterium HTCC2083]|nr:hypothetical protein RB2083_2202 [Rhodobacteraceae bacterium HTCC2083]